MGNLKLGGAYRSAAQRTFQESKSPLDIFDWKFEKYLTPWIVRITWIAVLVITTLWLFFVMVSFILSFLPDVVASAPPGSFGPSPRFPPSPRFETGLAGNAWLWLTVFRIIAAATTFVSTIIGLLWIRVLLEGAIVIFHIAKTLASIDEKTIPADSGN
jgi:hypothetical protein